MSYRMHADMTLGKVKLKVSDLRRSLDFYLNVVGFRILKQEGHAAELTVDGENALVELLEIPDAVVTPRRSSAGLYHFAILLPTRKDLGLQLRRMIESNIRIGQSDHGVSEALYITDPDLNGIEIYRDRPREQWQYDEADQVKMGGDPIDWDGLLREAEGSDWTGLPSGTTIGHVHFHASSMTESRRFYCDLLGFDLMLDATKGFGAIFISAGGYHHHIGLNIWAGEGAPAVPANGTGLDYFTIDLPDDAELGKITNRLAEAGVPIEEKSGASFVSDPSGIRLKLMSSKS
ncbi:VOC family protein [Paenibacillus mesophilus]|uniref:VOC family protein n=1 Tax=Paenibacillus mesophilus TaxID=2582849 RepID=UPI00110E745E|nr:VOC family protein [Paenibacillus mesophilus]TMV50066.1 VOC family protein [Paenibacillus mesophilus]